MIYFCFVFIDFATILLFRRLLFDFLCGNKTYKTAKKIRSEQPFLSRLLMSYVSPFLVFEKDKKAFKIYFPLYYFYLFLLFPLYTTLIFISIFSPKVQIILYCFMVLLRIIFLLIVCDVGAPYTYRTRYFLKPDKRINKTKRK